MTVPVIRVEVVNTAASVYRQEKDMDLESGFALLDVKRGRRDLVRKLGKEPVELIIHGTIKDTADVGQDDGTSREFTVHVTKVEVVE